MERAVELILAFSMVGVINTLYMIKHKIMGTELPCIFFPKEWCKKVQQSKHSRTMGVPNSVAGFVIYTLILIITLLFIKGIISTMIIAKILIWVGFLFSIYFTYIQGVVLRAYCTWCVISAICFLAMFITQFLI